MIPVSGVDIDICLVEDLAVLLHVLRHQMCNPDLLSFKIFFPQEALA